MRGLKSSNACIRLVLKCELRRRNSDDRLSALGIGQRLPRGLHVREKEVPFFDAPRASDVRMKAVLVASRRDRKGVIRPKRDSCKVWSSILAPRAQDILLG